MSLIIPRKLIYLAIPRTASVATESAIKAVCPEAIVTKDHHATLDSFELTTETIITTVRNPFDLFATWYQLNPEWQQKPFLNFINNYNHSHFIRRGTLFWQDSFEVDLLRYEHLQLDLNNIMEDLGLPAVHLEEMNITPGKKFYREYYGVDEVSAVENRVPNDIEGYAYAF